MTTPKPRTPKRGRQVCGRGARDSPALRPRTLSPSSMSVCRQRQGSPADSRWRATLPPLCRVRSLVDERKWSVLGVVPTPPPSPSPLAGRPPTSGRSGPARAGCGRHSHCVCEESLRAPAQDGGWRVVGVGEWQAAGVGYGGLVWARASCVFVLFSPPTLTPHVDVWQPQSPIVAPWIFDGGRGGVSEFLNNFTELGIIGKGRCVGWPLVMEGGKKGSPLSFFLKAHKTGGWGFSRLPTSTTPYSRDAWEGRLGSPVDAIWIHCVYMRASDTPCWHPPCGRCCSDTAA
jgi:hypothetical protein